MEWTSVDNQTAAEGQDLLVCTLSPNSQKIPTHFLSQAKYLNKKFQTIAGHFNNVTFLIPITHPDDPTNEIDWHPLPESPKTSIDVLVRISHNNQLKFAIAKYLNNTWQTRIGKIKGITHFAYIPKLPPVQNEYLD
jgi:hypothetical protein